MEKQDLMLFNVHGNKKGVLYKYVGWSNGFNKNPTRWFSLGNVEKLLEINENAIEIIKNKLKNFTRQDNPDKVKHALLHSIEKEKIQHTSICVGNELISEFIEKHNIFKQLKATRHKNMNEIFNFLVAKRIINPTSIYNSFNESDEYSTNIFSSKNSFYRLLDIVHENKDQLLFSINKLVESETKSKLDEIYFDSSTVYFESFSREGLRVPGYSKDAKFKEDQIVIGLACDKNGIPIYMKVFKGNTGDSRTMIPFILELETKFGIKNITIIADRGMSTNANIRFLEQRGHNFIISYRAKSGSQNFKNWILDREGYIGDSEFRYKETEYESNWKNTRFNGKLRRRIVTYSKTRAKKDREDRGILIDNFRKKQDKSGYVDSTKMLGTKKCKFFKQISKFKFELDFEKVTKDSEFDGIYVYETNISNISAEKIIEKYANQWKIETNFRALKSFLQIRPVYVRLDEHIIAHSILCFISLVLLKLITYKINKFYEDYGVIDHLSEQKLINILSKLRERVDINSKTKEIIKRQREDSKTIKDIWSEYDLIKKIVIKK
ncbi:putative new IS transposase [Mycoplasmopsis bovigenitalium]|uniref:IS1634 family transposase n=2 Tax=Mycoplasmopsis bovigenitalium TaxID=2112 RepID=UPI00090B7B1C|nr:IS1634 family transposase [Mycoplasmopsis bovigenitalium]BAW18140.1 putative new IS transposase [Mycoplasmopsis bovigenitalium]BAW18372.1 putative new IS transposase [Mycoplasmopsis bovigenitalium]BAW18492.1 putative new IS transposase [Mycoplasmopsis bovigenitalium]